MIFTCLAVAAMALHSVNAQGSGTSADPCLATCVGDECTFTAKLNYYTSETGYYQFEECGDIDMPVLGMQRGKTYTFLQHDHTNWMHPLGFAYDPDGAHKGNDELEPGITRGTTGCDTSNTCQKPMYYKDGVYLADPTDSDDFGLDGYEPKFKNTQDEWGEALWSVKLVLDDTTYDGDIFYLCHIHDYMSGRIKLLDASNVVIQAQDIPELGYEYHTPSPADALCGTTDLAPFLPGGAHHDFCMDSKYLCEEGPTYDTETQHFNQCLKAVDCFMEYHMQVTAAAGADGKAVTFMHQMIPHHQNAVNMAKMLLKTEPGDDELESMLREIINGQNMQITYMRGWLADKNVAEGSARCEADTRANPSGAPVVPNSNDGCDSDLRGLLVATVIISAFGAMLGMAIGCKLARSRMDLPKSNP